jgi:predicted dehydrogenase
MESKHVSVGVIGCGHWGPNHIRIFSQLPGSKVLMCADPDESRLAAVRKAFSHVNVTTDHRDILNNPDIQAVVIAAPTGLHYALTREALTAGKHVLCEKPLAMTAEECAELKELAEKAQKILMVGHIFLFNAGIVRLQEYIRSGELGRVQYAYALRTNLGPFRYDVNAWWDLAPHDISIFNYLFDSCPVSASGRGQKCLGESLEDLAFASLEYPGPILANIHVSWLDPKKVRQITIVGDKKMVVWDDLDNIGPIKLYDKHVEKTRTFYETYGEFQLLSREGSIMIPKVPSVEPLKKQAEYFLDCIQASSPAELTDAQKGLEVVQTLCAVQASMEQNGASVNVS